MNRSPSTSALPLGLRFLAWLGAGVTVGLLGASWLVLSGFGVYRDAYHAAEFAAGAAVPMVVYGLGAACLGWLLGGRPSLLPALVAWPAVVFGLLTALPGAGAGWWTNLLTILCLVAAPVLGGAAGTWLRAHRRAPAAGALAGLLLVTVAISVLGAIEVGRTSPALGAPAGARAPSP